MYVGPNDGNAAGVMADNILGLIFLRGGGRLLTVACPYFLPHSTLLAGRFLHQTCISTSAAPNSIAIAHERPLDVRCTALLSSTAVDASLVRQATKTLPTRTARNGTETGCAGCATIGEDWASRCAS